MAEVARDLVHGHRLTGGARPAVGGSTGAGKATQAPTAGKKQAGGDDDFSDIEAILKKHGI